ncbi:MAG: hypothetical protein WCF67_12780 [Chitinophagaceae bacterium]
MSELGNIIQAMPAEQRRLTLNDLCRHLQGGAQWEELEDILLNYFFLEERVNDNGIYEAVNDFNAAVRGLPAQRPLHRIISLLTNALDRYANFIERHPSSLFQCLWNLCWWYDCPEAALQYPLTSNSELKNLPWARRGWKLYIVLERWLTEKKAEQVEYNWLRSLRPPQVSLDSPLRAAIMECREVVESIAVSHDGNTIVFTDSYMVFVIDGATKRPLRRIPCGKKDGFVERLILDPTARFVTARYNGGLLRKWDIVTGHLVKEWEPDFHVAGIACSPDGTTIALGSIDAVMLVNAEHWIVAEELNGMQGRVTDVKFDSTGSILVASSDQGMVVLRNLQNSSSLILREVQEPALNSWAAVWNIAFSPDDKYFAAACGDGKAVIWNIEKQPVVYKTFDCRRQDGGPLSPSMRVAFSPEGNSIALSVDASIYLYDFHAGKEIMQFMGHEAVIFDMAFLPGGELVTAGYDRMVKTWDTNNMLPFRQITDTDEYFASCAFTTDGTAVIGFSDINIPPSISLQQDKDSVRTAMVNETICMEFACDSHSGQRLNIVLDKKGKMAFYSDIDVLKNGLSYHKAWFMHDDKHESLGLIADIYNGTYKELKAYSKMPDWPQRQHTMAWDGRELAVKDNSSEREIAWYPVSWLRGAIHPEEPVWAGTTGKYINLLRLEQLSAFSHEVNEAGEWYEADANKSVAYENIFRQEGLPTENEMLEIPRWARVAFAARSARYAQIILSAISPAVPSWWIETVDDALHYCERGDYRDTKALQASVHKVVTATNDLRPHRQKDAADASNAVFSANYAVYALRCAEHASDANLVKNAVDAAIAAVHANPSILHVLRGDFNRLKNVCKWSNWTNEDRDPLELFLWR